VSQVKVSAAGKAACTTALAAPHHCLLNTLTSVRTATRIEQSHTVTQTTKSHKHLYCRAKQGTVLQHPDILTAPCCAGHGLVLGSEPRCSKPALIKKVCRYTSTQQHTPSPGLQGTGVAACLHVIPGLCHHTGQCNKIDAPVTLPSSLTVRLNCLCVYARPVAAQRGLTAHKA
jgi:hypothetical protein